MIQCAILDNDHANAKLIRQHAAQIEDLTIVLETHSFREAMEGVQDGGIDILFIDLRNAGLTGKRVYRNFKDHNCAVVVTADDERMALESYESGALDFLLKPTDFTRFQKTIERYKTRYGNKNIKTVYNPNDCFLIPYDEGFLIVYNRDIEQIEGHNDGIILHFLGTSRYHRKYSFQRACSGLPDHLFVPVQSACIVSLNHIQKIEGDEIRFRNTDRVINIEPPYRDAFYSAFGKHRRLVAHLG